MLALVIAVGAVVCGVTPKVRRDGVWSVAPTWAMWGVLRSGRVPGDAFAQEFVRRLGTGGALQARAERVYVLVPSVRLTRNRWAKGVPLRARRESVFGSDGSFGAIQFRLDWVDWNDADIDRLEWVDSEFGGRYIQSHENWWTPSCALVKPFNGTTQNEVVLRMDCSTSAGGGNAYPTCRVPLTASIDDIMTPVSLSREKLLAAIRPTIFVLPTTTKLALSAADVNDEDTGRGVALGMKVEVIGNDGTMVARGRWYQSAPSSGGDVMGGRPVLVRFGTRDSAQNPKGSMTCTLDELLAANCVVRFSTDEEMALSALGCEKYWRGSFEVPLKELVK